jgi:hypothetical protein
MSPADVVERQRREDAGASLSIIINHWSEQDPNQIWQ